MMVTPQIKYPPYQPSGQGYGFRPPYYQQQPVQAPFLMIGESNAGNHKELDDFGFDNPNHHENEEGNHLAEMLQEPHFNEQ